ncbi:MAG TPA: ATP-binding cassette domain-containing protein [Thermoanaerobaculia bacterium]|nr:ATP-binding cassette domain-containing protein [Thermoanaerobaculia bacterium]
MAEVNSRLLCLCDVVSGRWDRPVSLHLDHGELVLLLGRNGAGKTTLLSTIAGLVPVRSGRIVVNGRDVSSMDSGGRASSGIRLAIEGRQVFSRLSVKRNLLLGAYNRKDHAEIKVDLDWLLGVFPDLTRKLHNLAGTLSGGQQTILNVARALMGRPSILLLDEPDLGLDPQNSGKLIEALREVLSARRTGVLVAEQSSVFARAFPDRIILLVGGEVVFEGSFEKADQTGRLGEIFA